MKLYADLETRGREKLDRCGAYKYAQSAEILLFSYALDDGPVQCWDALHEPRMPNELYQYLTDPNCTVLFHNVGFDRTIVKYVLGLEIPFERLYCTMAQAFAHGMPGKLEMLSGILGMPEDKKKIADGKRLIKLFCEKGFKPSQYPEDWQRFVEYAKNDIHAMREVHKRLPKSNFQGQELKLWRLDQKINERGFQIDLDLVRKARDLSELGKNKINERAEELTEGRVTKVTQTERLKKELDWSDALDKDAVKQRLKKGDVDPNEKELLELRQRGNRSSTSKFDRLLEATDETGRLRGVLIYGGASRTLRWSSKVFQAHNMPRPGRKPEEVAAGVQAIKDGFADLLYDDLTGLCTDIIRGVVVAAPGHLLAVGDWSNIEGRVLAWLAGETWKLQAFRELDAGTGPDLYELIYSRSVGCRIEDVTPKQRQMGKGQELSMGYGGGVGAFINVARSYGLDLEELAREVPKSAPRWALERARKRLKMADDLLGLTRDQFLACEALKLVWRAANPAIEQYWHALEEAAKKATLNAGRVYKVRHCAFKRTGNTLMIQLPSGRRLFYPNIRIDEKGQLSFMKAPAWYRTTTWGGTLAENITQAVARDVLAEAMPKVERAGYPVVLHVHDELVAEIPEADFEAGRRSHAQLCSIMEQNPVWAPDLPLAADGYTAYRYRKDD